MIILLKYLQNISSPSLQQKLLLTSDRNSELSEANVSLLETCHHLCDRSNNGKKCELQGRLTLSLSVSHL